jgi:hypothetical protein
MVCMLLTEHTAHVYMYASIGHMVMAKRGRSWLGIDRQGHRSSKGMDCDILVQCLIELI